MAVTGLLIARPWGDPVPTPTAAAVLPSNPPALDPTITPPLTPVPTSRVGGYPAPGPYGRFSLDGSTRDPVAICQYARTTTSRPVELLADMTIEPPMVEDMELTESPSRFAELLGWRVEVQAMLVQGGQSEAVPSEWQTVARSGLQLRYNANTRRGLRPDAPTRFVPLTVAIGASDAEPRSQLRALLTIYWYTGTFGLLGRVTVLPGAYTVVSASGDTVDDSAESCSRRLGLD